MTYRLFNTRSWMTRPRRHYHFRIGRHVFLPLIVVGPLVLARRDWDLW
jgi:hypothetical protein